MASPLRTILVPPLIRIKANALERLPTYLQRGGYERVLALVSDGLPEQVERHLSSCRFTKTLTVNDASIEWLDSLSLDMSEYDAICGLGGGKALDLAKVLAFRSQLPYLAVPTSLSNDGFCSPGASLTQAGKKTSLKARMPVGVVIDLTIVQQAPEHLWLSGVGDLVSKRTALRDWKIAFHTNGTPYDDLAALLSDATVFQFMARPTRDLEGTRLLAQALLLNGVAMEIAGCSRPASGSEHLISHALDQIAERPRGHGLQVGLATYWMALVQDQDVADIDQLFEQTGFWRYWQARPMSRALWSQALQLAPTIKKDFITVLDLPDAREKALAHLASNPRLKASLSENDVS